MLWVPVQAVDEHDVDGCGGVVVDAGYFETLYLVEGSFGALRERMSARYLVCGDFHDGRRSCTREHKHDSSL